MSVWRPMMQQRLTLEKGAVSTTPDEWHGDAQFSVSFDTPAATYTGLRCLFHQLSLKELAEAGFAGTTVAMFYGYLDRLDAPAGLLDQDSTPAPTVLYRATTVARASGAVIDAGPFDIKNIEDIAGTGEVIRLLMQRVA